MLKLTNKKIISPKYDFMFKKVFGADDSIPLLKDMLSSITHIPESEFDELSIVDPHLYSDKDDVKTSIVDVRVRLKSGTEVLFEMQRAHHSGFANRVLHSSSRAYSKVTKKGRDNKNVPQVITIVFADFIYYKNHPNVYHHKIVTGDLETGILFSDRNVIHLVELPKVPKGVNPWYDFLNAVDLEEYDMIAEENPNIKEAVRRVKYFSKDETLQFLAERQEDAEIDAQQRLWDAENRGEVRGKAEVAMKLLALGMDFEFISNATGLTIEQIQILSES